MACQGKDLRKSHQVSWSSRGSCRAQRTGLQHSAQQILEGPALPSSSYFKLLWKKPKNSGSNKSYYLLGAGVPGHLIRLFSINAYMPEYICFSSTLILWLRKLKLRGHGCGRNHAFLTTSNASQTQLTLLTEWEWTSLLSFKNLLENFRRKFS